MTEIFCTFTKSYSPPPEKTGGGLESILPDIVVWQFTSSRCSFGISRHFFTNHPFGRYSPGSSAFRQSIIGEGIVWVNYLIHDP